MSGFPLSTSVLETRDLATDKARLEARLEAYRDREPVEAPKLLIPTGATPPTPEGSLPGKDPYRRSLQRQQPLHHDGPARTLGVFGLRGLVIRTKGEYKVSCLGNPQVPV